ncbi:DNA polymerase sliding clamp [Desulfurococcaceae archaeon MEX13E-LK6-19]|nr:DNA polymerase sliding clamp [Desulfurococcaceae archaeon MEX13E-LK6-19]
MARVVYPEAKSIKSIVDSLAKLVDEVAITINNDGLFLKALDPARVALIEVMLPATSFLEYEVNEETTLGISMANLSKLLTRLKKGDRFELFAEEDYVGVTIHAAIKRTYRFKNLEVQVPEIPEASLEFTVEAQVLADAIKHAIKDAEAVGDTLEFEAKDDQALYMRGVGGTMAETKLTRDMPALIDLVVKEPAKSAYSIEYLKNVVALTKIAEATIVKFSNDAPIYLEFALAGEGRVKFLLAPKA